MVKCPVCLPEAGGGRRAGRAGVLHQQASKKRAAAAEVEGAPIPKKRVVVEDGPFSVLTHPPLEFRADGKALPVRVKAGIQRRRLSAVVDLFHGSLNHTAAAPPQRLPRRCGGGRSTASAAAAAPEACGSVARWLREFILNVSDNVSHVCRFRAFLDVFDRF